MWDELAVLARNMRHKRNQQAESYRTSDVLLSAMRRLAADASYWALSGKELTWENRDAFFAAAATAMRRAIVDHIRYRTADIRPTGKSRRRLPLDDGMWLARTEPGLMLDLDDCLEKLRETHPDLATIIEKKLFLPLSTMQELGEIFDMPSSTINDKLLKARTYLAQCLGFNHER
jgi:hypothetical protein